MNDINNVKYNIFTPYAIAVEHNNIILVSLWWWYSYAWNSGRLYIILSCHVVLIIHIKRIDCPANLYYKQLMYYCEYLYTEFQFRTRCITLCSNYQINKNPGLRTHTTCDNNNPKMSIKFYFQHAYHPIYIQNNVRLYHIIIRMAVERWKHLLLITLKKLPKIQYDRNCCFPLKTVVVRTYS